MPSTTKTVNLRAFSLHNPKNPRKTVPLESLGGVSGYEKIKELAMNSQELKRPCLLGEGSERGS